MLKKMTSVLLVMVFLLQIPSNMVFASQNSINMQNLFAGDLSLNENSFSESSEPSLTDGDYEYIILEDGSAQITKYIGKKPNLDADVNIVIPSEIAGVRVSSLGKEVFMYNDFIDSVLVPNTITFIDNAAFHHCEQLKSIAILSEEISYNFTVVEGSENLEKVLVLDTYDAARLSSLIINDLGEEKAKQVEIVTFDSVDKLTAVFNGNETSTRLINSINSQVVASGECGEFGSNITWSIDEYGILTVSGSGNMKDYSLEDAVPWRQYTNNIAVIVVESGIEHIGNYAFGGLQIYQITLPDTLKTIGDYAFAWTNYTDILNFNDGLESIGESAFRGVPFYGDLILPDSVQYIGAGAFADSNSEKGILKLPENIEILNGVQFAGTHFKTIIFGKEFRGDFGGTFETSATFGFDNVEELIFNGSYVPSIMDDGYSHALSTAVNLKKIYVPLEYYDEYYDAYAPYLDSSVEFISHTVNSKVENLTAANVYGESINITWDKHNSHKIIGYNIYRNEDLVATTDKLEYYDRFLDNNGDYEYYVVGYTQQGELSLASDTISVTTKSPKIIKIETQNINDRLTNDNNTISVTVANTKNLESINSKETSVRVHYIKNLEGGFIDKIFIGDAVLNEDLITQSTAVYELDWDVSAFSDGEYQIDVDMYDVDYTSDNLTKMVYVDNTLPEQILGVSAIGDINSIHINWSISSEIDSDSYNIYKKREDESEFTKIETINNRNTLTFEDTDVDDEGVYYYYVTTTNDDEEESLPSQTVSANVSGDKEKPLITKLSISNNSYLSKNERFQIFVTDNVLVAKVELYYSLDNGENWVLIGMDETSPFTVDFDTQTLSDGLIKFKALAYDSSLNESDALIYNYNIDNTGPEKVEGLSYESTSVSATIKWENVSDEDVSFFRVEQKSAGGEFVKYSDVYKTLGININNLSPNSQYTYRVVAYDIQGNRGESSSEITVETTGDVFAPVITQIRPLSGRYNDKISVSIIASDEYDVSSIVLQVSLDGKTWKDEYTKNFTEVSKSQVLNYDIMLNDYNEGNLYVRAVASDTAGNESVSDVTAPLVQYYVDKTAPIKPENMEAEGFDGYIEISWDQGLETDLNEYSIYRANSENGAYTLIKSGIKYLNYFDRTVESEITYFYKIRVDDTSGNMSEFSEVASAIVGNDLEKPLISSVYPQTGSKIGNGYKTVKVLATDNNELDKVLIEYRYGADAFSTLHEEIQIDDYNKLITEDIPVDAAQNGDTVEIRIIASDKKGNESEPVIVVYDIDLDPPIILSASNVFKEDRVELSWKSNNESDLEGFLIYRKSDENADYVLVSQRAATKGQEDYSWNDYNISDKNISYTYKIEAVDETGNTSSFETSSIELPDRSMPKPVISSENVFEVGVEYLISANLSTDNTGIVSYQFDISDGTSSNNSSLVHKFDTLGEYVITLKVEDDDGNVSTTTKTVNVKDRSVIGTVKIKVVDENGAAVPGAHVYFDLGGQKQNIKHTDIDGYAKFTEEVGSYTVGSIIANNEWLPTKKEVIITAGEETQVTLTLVNQTMIEGEFEISRMTFDEIVAAGIDISDPANQYYLQVDATLVYEEEEINTSFQYNTTTGDVTSEPVIITTPDGEKREIVPNLILPERGNYGGSDDDDDYDFSKDASIAYLDIPVGISALKDFFNVKLHIINNSSSSFSMLDNSVRLNVPDGLTLMQTDTSYTKEDVYIEEIKGQSTEVINWILRADEIGSYNIEADYVGVLSEFNKTVKTTFKSSQPIEVQGVSDLKLLLELPNRLDSGVFYYSASLINQGRNSMYMPTLSTGHQLIEAQLYDATGADLADEFDLTQEQINSFDIATSIEGQLNSLPAGAMLKKYYMSVEQTDYSDMDLYLNKQTAQLEAYAETMKNSYGIEVEIVVKDVEYFKSTLSAAINPIEKAEASKNENISAYEYLMNNDNYIYWSLFKSTNELDGALTTEAEENLWNLLTVLGDDGFKNLFGGDDEELIEAILIDAMEITAVDTESILYSNTQKWLEGVNAVFENPEIAEYLSTLSEGIGNALPRVFELILTEQKYEFFSYAEMSVGSSTDMIVATWRNVLYYEYSYTSLSISETQMSEFIHDLFSKEAFESAWESIGIAAPLVGDIVNAFEAKNADIGLFIAAQSNLESCNLFLDTIIEYTPTSIFNPDGNKVVSAAKNVKDTIADENPIKSILNYLIDNSIYTLMNIGLDKALSRAGAAVSSIAFKVKMALKLVEYIADNVFNVDQRNDTADKIRFVAQITLALQESIPAYYNEYAADKTEENAQKYMQMLSYMINIREIGEFQVAQFGRSYEVLELAYDSEELLFTVKEMSGAHDAVSWIEWNDFVQDKLSRVRVELLKNPLNVDASSITAPELSFDYSKGQTVQVFSDEYQYSIDAGKTWTRCENAPISFPIYDYSFDLYVRRIDISNSDEKMSSKITILKPESLTHSGIKVEETQTGYSITNLDPSKTYEVSFSETPLILNFGSKLDRNIEKGINEYYFDSNENFEYMYIRDKGNVYGYPSYILSLNINTMLSVDVSVEGGGSVSGDGKYNYGDDVTLKASPYGINKFIGWYHNDILISSDLEYAFEIYANEEVVAKFTQKITVNEDWILDSEEGKFFGLSKGTRSQTIIDYYESLGKSVAVVDANGQNVGIVGTGCKIIVDEKTYVVVIFGDVSGDGDIDMFDALELIAHVNGKDKLSGPYFEAGNINKADDIDIFDIYKVATLADINI